jgi:superfamily II DNA helicase RecQ
VDPPRTLLDYAQESERVGRNKLKNKAIMIVRWAKGNYEKKKEKMKLIQRLLKSRGEYRRAMLEKYLDEREKQKYREKKERYD